MRTDNVNPPVDVNPQSKVRIMPDLQIDRECVYGPPIPSPAKRLSKRIAFGLLALVAVAVILPVIINHCGHEQEGDQFTSEVFKVNGVSFTMNKVEGGSFMMGAAADDSDAKDWEKPRHRVTLDGYYIGETEVTQELWEAVMNDNPSQFKGKQNPVEQVSYDDCLTFVQKLNDKTGKKFRLPTEAEWEFAARGGIHSKQYKYAGSDNIDDVAWYWRNSGDDYIGWDYCNDSLNSLEKNHHCQTHPVKRKQPNELGLYDMTGNVIEWCSDWYERYSGEEMYNPCGPDSNSIDKPMKVRRGGYYLQSAGSSRNTYRMYVSPKGRHEWLGFRLALSVANEN
ncbi:MAG: SUMF1/EgtB/PvdO family nonheme iron enzyme [bacterium]|nr:SUMF1/EgtB/PvdO family nonheme iron enzyme [Candidatus Limimorpha equi]